MNSQEVEADKSDLEKDIEHIQTRIRRTLNLPVDNLGKSTGAPIDETMYPPIKLRRLTKQDLQDLADLFSGKIQCRVKQVYTGDPIIDSVPMANEPDPNLWDWPQWVKDRNLAIWKELTKNDR
jgi:hypothetical protein